MDRLEIIKMIKQHEGYRPYIYYDSIGYPTGGYGHAFLPHSPLPHDVAVLLFENDFKEAERNYDRLELNLSPIRRAVVVDMLFNLGLTRLIGFRRMLAALKKEDYKKAAYEMLDSKWAKQVKSRAFRLAQMMRRGE